jgi:chromate reductase, NAD(P)H dehydrogenase (quinone)
MADHKRKVLAFCGSTREASSNETIIQFIASSSKHEIEVTLYTSLADLPHFNPGMAENEIPQIIHDVRNQVAEADGVVICTPEYIFAAPAVLKNMIEWMVGVNVFADKPVMLIVASGLGEKTFESLTLMLDTLSVRWNEDTRLLIQGARAKLTTEGNFSDHDMATRVTEVVAHFIALMNDTAAV